MNAEKIRQKYATAQRQNQEEISKKISAALGYIEARILEAVELELASSIILDFYFLEKIGCASSKKINDCGSVLVTTLKEKSFWVEELDNGIQIAWSK